MKIEIFQNNAKISVRIFWHKFFALMKVRSFCRFLIFGSDFLFLKIVQSFYCERTKKKNKKH